MMDKNDRASLFELDPQVPLNATVQKNGWFGRFGRSEELRDTTKSLKTCLAVFSIWTTMRGSTTPITIFSAEKDEEQAANYDDR